MFHPAFWLITIGLTTFVVFFICFARTVIGEDTGYVTELLKYGYAATSMVGLVVFCMGFIWQIFRALKSIFF